MANRPAWLTTFFHDWARLIAMPTAAPCSHPPPLSAKDKARCAVQLQARRTRVQVQVQVRVYMAIFSTVQHTVSDDKTAKLRVREPTSPSISRCEDRALLPCLKSDSCPRPGIGPFKIFCKALLRFVTGLLIPCIILPVSGQKNRAGNTTVASRCKVSHPIRPPDRPPAPKPCGAVPAIVFAAGSTCAHLLNEHSTLAMHDLQLKS